MKAAPFTIDEKLAQIEAMIVLLRYSESTNLAADYRSFKILQAIASDLRARRDDAPAVAAAALGSRITRAIQQKTPAGYHTGHLIGIAEELIGRWPVVSQALEKFGHQIEESRT